MKNIFTFIVTMAVFLPAVINAQSTQQSIPVPEELFRDEADNNGYWKDAVRRGLDVPLNKVQIPVKPAEPVKDPRGGSSPTDQMGDDVCVWDETGVTQSENSTAVRPSDDQYVLNSNNSESGGSIYGANYLHSYNGGASWSGSHSGAGGANWGDPAAAIGPTGRRYIGYIASNAGQGVSYSDNGTSWTAVSVGTVPSTAYLLDKNHLTVDQRTSGSYSGYVYSAWTRFQSGHANDNEIEFVRSTNNGVSWSSPINISSAVSAGNHNQGVNIQTGPTGQVYAVWVIYDNWSVATGFGETAIGFARSLNGGSSFYSAQRIHNNILGIRPRPSTATTNPTGKNMRVNSFPSMAVDCSGGAYNGNIYVTWANVGTPGTNTGTNVSIYCMRSTNGGVSWNTPVRINQGTTSNDYASFFPWITCDQETGKLYCVFYDDRTLGSTSSDLETWCAYSEDGGVTWQDFRVGDVSFTPSPISGLALGYFGDYLGIDARNNYVYPTWTDNRSGRALTYVSPIHFTDYCIGTGGCYEYISNVTVGSIDNDSDCDGYANYTDLSADVLKGSTETVSVTIGDPFSGDDITVYADWNRDGDFDDASELIGYETTTTTANINMTVPSNILSGPVTLRVRLSYSGSPPADACGSTYYGEVEDYTLNVYEYCVAGGGCDEYISNVQIGSINNSSGCDGYADYSNLSTNIDYLSSATVTVTNGVNTYASDQCGIWVDWNNDTDFNDANETIIVSGTPGVGPYTALIDPPADVIPGQKTMRVRITYTGTVSPCGTTTYGEVEDYTINVTGPNTWIGGFNHYWHQAANWSAGHIPLAGEDVRIPNLNQPVYVDDYPGFTQENCTDLTIEAGASVEIRNMRLVVNGNLAVNGEITMVEDNGYLDIHGDAYWNSGSSFDATTYNTFVNAWGNWNFNAGSNFSPTTGFVDFEGSSDIWVRSYSTTSNFYIMRANKTGGAAVRVSNLSDQDLVVNGLTYVAPGAAFNSLSNFDVVLNGAFNYYGTFDFTLNSNTGSVVFNGTTQTMNNFSTGSGIFNNLVFSSSTGTTIVNGDLDIAGAMTIGEGYLDIGDNTVNVTSDVTILGELVMTDPSGVLNCGESLNWNNGSTANVTAGNINLQLYCYFNNGSDAQIGAGNTMNFIGDYQNSIFCASATSHVGTLVVDMVSGTAYCHSGSLQPIVVAGDMVVNGGNTFKVQAYDLQVMGNLSIADGAFMDLGSGFGQGYVDCQSNVNLSGQLDLDFEYSDYAGDPGKDLKTAADIGITGDNPEAWWAGEFYVHGNYDQTATGTINILGGGIFSCDKPGTSIIYVRGNFNLDDGIFEVPNNHVNLLANCNINGGTIRCGGTFWANSAGAFQPTGGVVELIGSGGTGQYISVNAVNYFYDLVINRTNTIQIYGGTELHVLNDFTIQSGGLATNSMDMYVGGDWDNQVGPAAFVESSGKVVFNGPGPLMQFINSDEQFNILENNTVEAIRINSSADDVVCNSYNWISGGVSVYQGSFTANDLAQSGIYGNWYALAGSEIILNQTGAQFVDMFGDILFINGGMMKVIGGNDESFWCSSTPLALTITNGGVLDFEGPGVTIFSNAALTYNMSGGTLRTSGYLTVNRTDFNPAGSLVEFYGGNDAQMSLGTGSSFDDLLVNKSGGDESTFVIKDRDGKISDGIKSNTLRPTSVIVVEGNLSVNEGLLDLNTKTIGVYGDANVNNGGILQVGESSVFAMGPGSDLNINNGGWLLAVGSSSYGSTLTHISGYYNLTVETGGYISAEYALFEYMSTPGIFLQPGSTVNAVYSFNNCTIRNGAPGGNLFTIANTQSFTASDVNFPTNTWGGSYNVYKNVSGGNVYFPDAVGGFAGQVFEYDPNNLVHWDYAPLTLALKVMMEGPFDSGSGKMSTGLNATLPHDQPFEPSLPYYGNPMPDWYYGGSENVGAIPNPFIVDWMLIQLRDAGSPGAATPATAIATVPAFVLNTGDVVALDGVSNLEVPASYASNLYVVLWNRNHLGIISALPLVESGGVFSYDFTTAAGQAWGGTSAQKNLGGGVYGMMSGDGNGDGDVTGVDESVVWEAWAGSESAYAPGDFNLDTQTNNIDKNDFWQPNMGAGSQIPE